MIIYLKNKDTLVVDTFEFKCCIGKNGISKKKIEGDKKTPIGLFNLEHLYLRKDKTKEINTKLKKIFLKKDMGWCNDVKNKKKYNKLIKSNNQIKHEKLFRKDYKYDLVIPIKYNYKNPIPGKGSCIFIHLTKNYKSTAGCIALKKKDFLIMLMLIDKKTKIKIS